MHLHFQEGVVLQEENLALKVQSSRVKLTWQAPPLFQRQLLKKLTEEPTNVEFLADLVYEKEGSTALSLFYCVLHQLKERSLLSYTVMHDEERPLLTLIPLTTSFKWNEEGFHEIKGFQVSHFCFSYILNGEKILETPLQTARVVIKDVEMILFLKALLKPASLQQLNEKFSHLPFSLIEECLKLLYTAKIILPIRKIF